MQEYRLFLRASNGRPVCEPEIFRAPSDEAAINKAMSRRASDGAELWSGESLIAVVEEDASARR